MYCKSRKITVEAGPKCEAPENQRDLKLKIVYCILFIIENML